MHLCAWCKGAVEIKGVWIKISRAEYERLNKPTSSHGLCRGCIKKQFEKGGVK